MAVRNESVRLTLEDEFSTKMAKVAAVTALAHRELEDLNGTAVNSSGLRSVEKDAEAAGHEVENLGSSADSAARDVESLGKETEETGRQVEALGTKTDKTSRSVANGSNEIDKYSGRLQILGEVAAIATPGLVAFGATGVAASAGLTAALGTTVATVGTAIVAFQGVGDAVKALSAYNLQPTAQTLQAAQLALSQLGPDAAKFALEFERLTPTLHDIRDAAAAGWFPGLTRALDDMVAVAPKVESLFKAIGTAGGDAVAGFADDVKGGAFNDLFAFLQTEAPKAITALSAAGASVAHGLSQMLIATGSADDSFLSWVDKVADGFDRWASSAQGRQDISDFLDYVREQAPNVEHLIAAVAEAIGGIVKAAAPLSGVTLKAFTALAQAVANIANSDLGTPIVAGVIALSAYNRALAVTAALQKSAFSQSLTSGSSLSFGNSRLMTMIGSNAKVQAAAAVAPSKNQWGQYFTYWGQSAKYASAQTMEARAAVSTFGKSLAPMAASAARAGAVVGGLAVVQSGLTDKLGLSNTATYALMGSFVGPWGTAIGGAIGFAKDFSAANDGIATSLKQAQQVADSMDFSNYDAALQSTQTQIASANSKSNALGTLNKFTGGGLAIGALGQHFANVADDGSDQLEALRQGMLATEQTAAGLGRALGLTVGPLDGSARSANELTDALQMAAPAMAALKTNATNLDIAHTLQLASGAANPLGGLLRGFGVNTQQYAHLYTDSVDQIVAKARYMNSQAGREQGVADAIKSIGTNALNSANAATTLQTALDGVFSPGLNLSAATDTWDASLRNLTASFAKHTKTLAGDTAAADQNRASIRQQVTNLEALLVAQAGAGAGAGQLTKTLNSQTKALIATAVQSGVSRTQLKAYLQTLGLTPSLVKTVLQNNADQARNQVLGVTSALNAMPTHKEITITTHMNEVHGKNVMAAEHADGGYITGPGTGRSDSIPAWLSNGEFVVNAAATARNLPLLHRLNAQRFADGGFVGSTHASTSGVGSLDDASRKASDGVHGLSRRLSEANTALDKQKSALQNLRQTEQTFASSITSSFRSDLFGSTGSGSSDIWAAGSMSGSDPIAILRQDIANAKKYRSLDQTLRRRGLTGAALQAAESAGLTGEETLVGYSGAELRTYSTLYRERQRLSRSTGSSIASADFGHGIKDMVASVHRLESRVHSVENAIHAEHKRSRASSKHDSDDNARKVADGVNHAATSGHKRSRS